MRTIWWRNLKMGADWKNQKKLHTNAISNTHTHTHTHIRKIIIIGKIWIKIDVNDRVQIELLMELKSNRYNNYSLLQSMNDLFVDESIGVALKLFCVLIEAMQICGILSVCSMWLAEPEKTRGTDRGTFFFLFRGNRCNWVSNQVSPSFFLLVLSPFLLFLFPTFFLSHLFYLLSSHSFLSQSLVLFLRAVGAAIIRYSHTKWNRNSYDFLLFRCRYSDACEMYACNSASTVS